MATVYEKVEAAHSALRDMVGMVPKADRHLIEKEIRTLEALLSEHSDALQALAQIQNIAHRAAKVEA